MGQKRNFSQGEPGAGGRHPPAATLHQSLSDGPLLDHWEGPGGGVQLELLPVLWGLASCCAGWASSMCWGDLAPQSLLFCS